MGARFRLILRLYLAIALIITAVISPLTMSFVPIILLAWYLFQTFIPINVLVRFLTEYFLFFAIGILYDPWLGPFFSLLVALPIMLIINQSLQESAQSLSYQETKKSRRPTNLGITVGIIVVSLILLAVTVRSVVLLLSAGVVIAYFMVIAALILSKFPRRPVVAEPIQFRMVAGKPGEASPTLITKTKFGGLLFVNSPYEWLKVKPQAFIPLKTRYFALTLHLNPSLSGPSQPRLQAYALDCWGLSQVKFELEPLTLIVMPRAKYAEWIAQKYLAGTKPGTLPLISNIGAIKQLQGLRRGVEYYGNQIYQPGDSLKNIDWKHSSKYNELVVKKFGDIQGQPAIILLNLIAINAEEADKLAYNVIATAISLAQDNIPAAFAVYDMTSVVQTTETLSGLPLISRSVGLIKKILIQPQPLKYLKSPDFNRLQTNIKRLGQVEGQSAKVLRELLQLEYRNTRNNARNHPCTKALSEVFSKASQQSSLVIISGRNHDAEALVFNAYSLTSKGNAVISI